jgi:aminoglycoside phosphotransferase (APT) family kinase protein
MSGTRPDVAAMLAHLTALARGIHGAQVQARALAVMEDGHAGLTYGYEVASAEGQTIAHYVLKLGPAGVPRRGSTDVFRQAALLRALHAQGLPVPAVPFASADEHTALGAPYIVMQRLPGRTFVIWEPHASFPTDDGSIRDLWLQAARALAAIHRLDVSRVLPGWEAPTTLASELERWNSLLRHAPEPAWLSEGQALFHALVAQQPAECSVGLVHGDYQPGNVLYEDARLVGVIDWDLACIAPQGIDVGWLLMMIDSAAWADGWKPRAPIARDALLAAYREAGGPALHDLDWYQAFGQFALGAIACLNVKLHRNGRRPDALWERFAPSVETLFARAKALLGERA